MKNSKLHIIMPIYNAAATLPRAVSSLCCISPRDRHRVHLIGVEDGSTDDSAAVFERTVAEVEGIQWSLLHRQNGGSSAARNDALRTFFHGWTLCLDADDELVTNPIPFLNQTPEATSLLFDADFHREKKQLFRMPARQLDIKKLPQLFSARNPFHPLSIIFRRELLDCFFPEDLRFLEDWYFLASNPRFFARCVINRGIALGKIHGSKQSKSADQHKNGYYRVMVAERLSKYWANEKSLIVRNNLAIQNAIGKVQMGESAPLTTLLLLPATISLYVKLWIYLFAYRLYLRFYPYA